MANEIDLVVGQAAFDRITELLTALGKVDTKFGELSTKFAALGNNTNTIKSTADLAKLTAENAKLNTIIEKQIKDFADLNEKLAKVTITRTSSIKGITEETVAQRELNKEATLNATVANNQIGAYARLDAQHKQSVKIAQDLAAANKQNTEQYKLEIIKVQELGSRLKAIDNDVGKHTRNVGNYASSWNGLSNSINNITREAPAFANSIATGFMALSNNLPILGDEINAIRAKNKALAEDGKPTVGVLKQLANGFFSWQTLISVGVTLLTVYGSKLVDMARGLGDVKAELEALDKLQKKYNNNLKNTTDTILHNAKLAKDEVTLRHGTQKEKDAIDEAAQRKILKNNEVVRDANKKLLDDEVKKVFSKQKISTKGYEDLLDGDNKYEKSKAEITKKYFSLNGKEQQAFFPKLQAINMKYRNEEKKIDALNNSEKIQALKKYYTLQNGETMKAGVELSELVSSQKAKEVEAADKLANKPVKQEKKVLKFDEVKSEKDLQQAKIEGQKIDLESADLDKMTTEDKIINRNELTKIQLAAIKSVQEEEIKVADKKQIDDKVENDRALKNKTIDEKQHFDNIQDINKTHQFVIDKINVEASNKTRQLKTADLKYNQDLLDKDAANKQKHTINQFEAEKLVQKELSEESKKNSSSSTKERADAFAKFKEISKEELQSQRDFALSKTVIKTEQQLINDEYDKGIKLLDNMADPLDAIKNKTKDWLAGFAQTGLDSPLKAFGMESAKMFLDFDENNESTFTKMYDNAEKGKEKFAVAFGAISEVGQGAFNAIAQASMAQYEGEYKRLEAQKEASLKFTGDSAIAKEKIEKDYAAKKKEIDKRKFEDEKKISMVNIVIDTAQAVVATLAKGGGFFASPLAMIVAALGAAQLGMVAAQQFPAYAKGTDNHKGGLMLVNDGTGSNFQEKVILPSGKVIRPQGRNVLMNAPKGTKVLNHEQQLFEMLQSNNISMSSQQASGLTYDEMNEIFQKNLSNIKTQNTIFDKNGFQTYVRNGNSITRSNSNRSQAIGISV